MTSMASPPPSPLSTRFSSPARGSMPLKVADVANIFVKMRRGSPRHKQQHIQSSSGEPYTHPSLAAPGAVSECKVPLVQKDLFVCRDAVDVVKLLRLARASLYEQAEALGANVLVAERWSCTICGPRDRSGTTYRVHIEYSASAARSDKPDPQRPPLLEKAQGVPGLMTILSRSD